MATVTLEDVGTIYPEGSTVAAHPRDQWGGVVISGAPRGEAIDTSPVEDGELVFAGLLERRSYVAYALIGGVPRHVEFYIEPEGDVVTGRSVAKTPKGSGVTSATPGESLVLIPSADDRGDWSLYNKHAFSFAEPGVIWLAKGPIAVVGEGIPLLPGGTWGPDDYTGDVSGASDTASVPYSFWET